MMDWDNGTTMWTTVGEANLTEMPYSTNSSPPVEETPKGANIASPIVMFLAGLLGNVLALVVLHKTRTEIRSMMFYTLVAALTWNDLIGIVLTSPVTLAAYINGREMPAVDRLCRFNGFVMVCFGLSTPLIVCTMAIERSLALKCTYFYSKYCTPASARIVVVALWAFVLLFGALPLFGFGTYSLQYPRTWCFLDFRSSLPLDMAYAYAYAIVNLLIVVLMTSCNLVVMATLCQVRDSRRKHSSASLSSSLLATDVVDEKVRYMRRRNQRDVELQMIWLVCAITTIFAVCWVPLMVHILLTLSTDNQEPVLGLVAIRLASLNQTLNPWLYVILRKALLARLRRTFTRCVQCGDDDSEDSAYLRRHRFHNYAPQHNFKQYEGQPRGYVHVRNQLCPSSQFVGRQNEAVSLSEGSMRSGDRNSRGSKSRSRSRSRSAGRHSSDSDRQSRSYAADTAHLCSACRAHALMTAHAPRRCKATGSPPPGSFTDSPQPACSGSTQNSGGVAVQHPDARSVTDNVADAQSDAFSETPDGIYVDLFRRLPDSSLMASFQVQDPTRRPPAAPEPESKFCRQARDLGPATPSVSETDDHGYGSRVSSDSSRTSSSEAIGMPICGTQRSPHDEVVVNVGDGRGNEVVGSHSSGHDDVPAAGVNDDIADDEGSTCGPDGRCSTGGGSLSSSDRNTVSCRQSSPGTSTGRG